MNDYDARFIYKGYDDNTEKGSVQFRYELVHQGITREFTETLSFTPPPPIDPATKGTCRAILHDLHILLGISYWKTYCPQKIIVEGNVLTKGQAEFWNTVYTKGLGEFFYKNGIDYRGLVNFPFGAAGLRNLASSVRKDRSLVLLGAGKDSLVTSDLLKEGGKQFSFFTLNPQHIHALTASLVGSPLLSVVRTIDPKLFELNKKSGVYNGHIPISAIFAFVGLLAAHLYDYRFVIASNEQTASFGNVGYLGQEVNHQWSKSFEFEQLLSAYVRRYVSTDVTYFSLLRPLTELGIVKIFSGFPQYFDTFTSCNSNFRILGSPPKRKWCGHCPKCAFVFLLLACFLPKKQLVSIFGKNMLSDETHLKTYRELLGLEGIKPFECVGTPQETIAAFIRVVKRGEFRGDGVVERLTSEIQRLEAEKNVSFQSALTSSSNHAVPGEFQSIIPKL